MLRFSLFGFPVTVHWMFWVMVALLGGGLNASGQEELKALLLWVAAAFVSVLIHELGHTFMQRRFGARAQIVLYAFGGLAVPDRRFTRGQDIVVSFMGPLVQIVAGVACWKFLENWLGVGLGVRELSYISHGALGAPVLGILSASMALVSIFWGVLNLLPILPLDGGHILRGLLGPRREKLACYIGAACAAALAIWMGLVFRNFFNALFFGALAWQNFQRAQGQQPPSIFAP